MSEIKQIHEQERAQCTLELYQIEARRKALKKRLNELEIILLTEQKTRAEVQREAAQKPPAPDGDKPAAPPDREPEDNETRPA